MIETSLRLTSFVDFAAFTVGKRAKMGLSHQNERLLCENIVLLQPGLSIATSARIKKTTTLGAGYALS